MTVNRAPGLAAHFSIVKKPLVHEEAVLDPVSHRDIIVIGGSAGGLRTLERLLPDLPGDLPAAVFIVIHVGARSHLAQILDRTSRLPVLAAESGLRIEPGRVYVAVPGAHLLLHDRHILLRRGPRENLARPAIDPLFRSAACTFGARVIGVVLSGELNDGTAGLRAIKECGGIAVVEEPDAALFPAMARNAVRHVNVDHIAPAGALGGLLVRLIREVPGETPSIPEGIRLEAAIAAQELSGMNIENTLGRPSRFTCPECHGTLWEIDDANLLRYRCYVGHAYTAQSALEAQTTNVETTLWRLMRLHQERAALVRRMAQGAADRAQETTAADLRRRAAGYDEDAEIIRRLLREYAAAEEGDIAQETS